MKHILFVLVAVLLVTAFCEAQISPRYATAFNNVTYAASENDTSATCYVGGASKLVLVLAPHDSINADVYVQYKSNGTWTTVLTDSLITTSATYEQEYSIIDSDSDLLDGLYFPLRVIVAARATKNGVTTPTLLGRFYYML